MLSQKKFGNASCLDYSLFVMLIHITVSEYFLTFFFFFDNSIRIKNRFLFITQARILGRAIVIRILFIIIIIVVAKRPIFSRNFYQRQKTPTRRAIALGTRLRRGRSVQFVFVFTICSSTTSTTSPSSSCQGYRSVLRI